MSSSHNIVELNVGGVFYTTSLATLTSEPSSRLAKMFEDTQDTLKDSKVSSTSAQNFDYCAYLTRLHFLLEKLSAKFAKLG